MQGTQFGSKRARKFTTLSALCGALAQYFAFAPPIEHSGGRRYLVIEPDFVPQRSTSAPRAALLLQGLVLFKPSAASSGVEVKV